MSNDLHKRQLAKIHLLKKQLGLDDDTYRALLLAHGGHNSAKDMNSQQKVKVINWMAGYVNGKKAAEEFADRNSLFAAIVQLRRTMQRHSNYVVEISIRMFGDGNLNNRTVLELGIILSVLREQHEREAA